MNDALEEIRRLRGAAEDLRGKVYKDALIRKLLDDVVFTLKPLIPNAKMTMRNNKWVYNFGIKGMDLVMVERVHKGRNAVPQKWRSRQIKAVIDLLDYLEAEVTQ